MEVRDGMGQERQPAILLLGMYVGAIALTTSIIGLLWRVDIPSFVIACIVGIGLATLASRGTRFEIGTTLTAVVVGIPFAALLLWAVFLPAYHWDDVAYQLALPRDYARARRFFYQDDYGPYSAFPSNFEALTTVGFLFFKTAVATKVLNLVLALGLAGAAVVFCSLIGAPRICWPLAAALVLAAPDLGEYASDGKNDVANAFFESLALVAAARYLVSPSRRALGVAGAFLGLALGTKYSSLLFALCLTGCLVPFVVLRRAATRWGDLAVFAAVAALCAAPWYLRNLILFHNPFYPFYNDILRADNSFSPAHTLLLKESFHGIEGYGLARGDLTLFLDHFITGFGALLLVLTLLGITTALLLLRTQAALFLVSITVTFWIATFELGYWLPRFSFALLPLSACFAATLPAHLATVLGGGSTAAKWGRLASVTLGLAVVMVGGTTHLHERLAPVVEQWHSQDERQFLADHVPYWPVADWLNKNLDEHDRVGIGFNLQPFLYLNRSYLHIHTLTEKGNLQSMQTPDDFMQDFKSLHLTVLAIRSWDPVVDGYRQDVNPLMYDYIKRFNGTVKALADRGSLKPLAVVQGVHIFRIVY